MWPVAGCCDQFCGTAAREFTLGVAGAGKKLDPINLEFATSRDRVHPKQVANIEGNTIISGTSRFVIFFDLALIRLLLGGSSQNLHGSVLNNHGDRKCPKDLGGSLPHGLYKWHRRTYMGLNLTTYKSYKSWDDPPCCCLSQIHAMCWNRNYLGKLWISQPWSHQMRFDPGLGTHESSNLTRTSRISSNKGT